MSYSELQWPVGECISLVVYYKEAIIASSIDPYPDQLRADYTVSFSSLLDRPQTSFSEAPVENMIGLEKRGTGKRRDRICNNRMYIA